MRFVRRIAAGAVGGLVGGLVLTLMMLVGRRTGMAEEPLPLEVERRAEGRLGLAERTTPEQELGLATTGHMLLSTVMGVDYALLQSMFRPPWLAGGLLYGLGAYAINVAGLGPALGLTPGPWGQPTTTAGRQVMTHVLFGLVVAWVFDRLRPRVGQR